MSVCPPLKSGSIVELHYSRFLLLAGSLDWMGKRSEGKRYNYFVSDNSDGNKRGEMEKKGRAQAMAKVCESFSAVIPFLPISPYFYDLFYILLSFFYRLVPVIEH